MVVGRNKGRKERMEKERIKRKEKIGRCSRIEIEGRIVGKKKERRIGKRERDWEEMMLEEGKIWREMRGEFEDINILKKMMRELWWRIYGKEENNLRKNKILKWGKIRKEVMEMIEKEEIVEEKGGEIIIRKIDKGK